MKLGLYSELARQHITKIREKISKEEIAQGTEGVKSFRSYLINSNHEQLKKISDTPDFYSISELRDLLFHVQEHRFTIPQIKQCLDELGLKFCGFEGNTIVSKFKRTNFHHDDLYDLDKWQAYEQANPRAFAGMYQFWCQKVD